MDEKIKKIVLIVFCFIAGLAFSMLFILLVEKSVRASNLSNVSPTITLPKKTYIYQIDNSIYPIIDEIQQSGFIFGELTQDSYSDSRYKKGYRELIALGLRRNIGKEKEVIIKHLQEGDYYLVLDYIEDMYLSNIHSQIMAYELDEAKRNIDRAFHLYSLIDTDPLEGEDDVDVPNRILLFNSILCDPDLFFDVNICSDLMLLFDSSFSDEDINKISLSPYGKDLRIQDHLSYAMGVKLFKEADYNKARAAFEEITLNSDNLLISDLANLMIVRCHFWEYEFSDFRTGKWREAIIEKSLERKALVRKNSLKQDIDVYIKSLGENEEDSQSKNSLLDLLRNLSSEEIKHLIESIDN